MKRWRTVLILVFFLFLSGCVTRAVREKQAQYCDTLASLDRAIATLRRLSDSSAATLTAVREAEARVTTTFLEVKAAAREFTNAEGEAATENELANDVKDLEDAYQNLDQTIQDLSDESALRQTKETIAGHMATLESVSTRMQSTLRCPSPQ